MIKEACCSLNMYISRSVTCLRPLKARSCLYFLPVTSVDLLECLVSLSIVRGLISLLHCHHREEQRRHLADVWRALLPNSSMCV